MKNAKKRPRSTREALLRDIRLYLKQNRHISKEYFGWLTIKDKTLVARLESGKDVTTRKLDTLLAFLQKPPIKGTSNA